MNQEDGGETVTVITMVKDGAERTVESIGNRIKTC